MEDPFIHNDYISIPLDASLHSNVALVDRENGKDI